MATVDKRLDGLDQRMAHIEQVLPALATREELQAAVAVLATRAELQAAIAPLATREELQAAIAPLATREEMHTAIQTAVAPLATREEMHAAIHSAIAPLATREEMQEEGERTRTYMKVLIEDVRDEIRLVAEGHVALDKRDLNQHGELKENVAALDTRVTRLEVSERRRRRRA